MKLKFSIFNHLGMQVKNGAFDILANSLNTNSLDISGNSNGLYFMVLSDENFNSRTCIFQILEYGFKY
jgi:hypothetical protein